MRLSKLERQFVCGCTVVVTITLALVAFLAAYPFYSSISGREDIIYITVLSKEAVPVEGTTFSSPNLLAPATTDLDGKATLRISRNVVTRDAFMGSQLMVTDVELSIHHDDFQLKTLFLPGMGWEKMTANLHWNCLSSQSSEIEVTLNPPPVGYDAYALE